MTELAGLLAEQAPEDVGKSGPLGLLLTVVLLMRSMSKHLKRIPPSFDPVDPAQEVPDTPAELFEPRTGDQLLDTLRNQPRAIEGPRRDDDGRPGGPTAG